MCLRFEGNFNPLIRVPLIMYPTVAGSRYREDIENNKCEKIEHKVENFDN